VNSLAFFVDINKNSVILFVSPAGGYKICEKRYLNMSVEEKQHQHTHNPEDMKAIINRLSRAIGHLDAVKRMVEDGQDCSKVLIQLSAVKSAINNVGKLILKEHISHCIVDAVEHDDKKAIKDLNNAIDKFMK